MWQTKSSGGADKFLQFIETELMPEVEKRYRTQPFRVLAGHSLGGLFAVHALSTRPGLFNAYVAVSPSLWWDGQSEVNRFEGFIAKQKAPLKAVLFFSVGNETAPQRAAFERLRQFLATSPLPPRFEWDWRYNRMRTTRRRWCRHTIRGSGGSSPTSRYRGTPAPGFRSGASPACRNIIRG